MCTLSWLSRGDGYTLFFNRDERRTRAPAHPPAQGQLNGVHYLAPTDGDFGGSWIGVNDQGLALCLLNRYEDAPAEAPARPVSRGLLLTSLLDCGWIEQLARRMDRVEVNRYQPFTLAGFDSDARGTMLAWDGAALRAREVSADGLVITSSGFDQAGAEGARTAIFAAAMGAGLDEARLDAIHRSHQPERGPFSVCMHRDDAETVSLSRVRVTPERVELDYWAGSPCLGAAPVSLSLRRPAGISSTH